MFSAWSLVMSMPARIEAMDRPAIYPSRRPSMWLSEENIFWEDIRMRIEPDRMGFCQTLVRLSLDVNELHRNHAPQIAAGSTLDDQPTRCLDPDVPQTSWYVVGGLFACRIPTQPCMSSRRRLATLRISRSGNRQETPLVSIRSVNEYQDPFSLSQHMGCGKRDLIQRFVASLISDEKVGIGSALF